MGVTLRVPFESFPDAVKRVLGVREVFVAVHASGSLVTAAEPSKSATVAAVAPIPISEARQKLIDAGFEVFTGQWSMVEPGDLGCDTEAFVAAVAYQSAENRPGLWIDAFFSLPTTVQVLRGMYEEFRSTGEVQDVSFEEFVRLANPNVVIVSPSDLRSFLSQKG